DDELRAGKVDGVVDPEPPGRDGEFETRHAHWSPDDSCRGRGAGRRVQVRIPAEDLKDGKRRAALFGIVDGNLLGHVRGAEVVERRRLEGRGMRVAQEDAFGRAKLETCLPRRLRAEIAVVVVTSGSLYRKELPHAAAIIGDRGDRRAQFPEDGFRV